ncbi:(2E,6E)-farnesyl diphosphate synthase [bacterium]|nr:(2E,6E)-farnesyl diphosphate synthase [bacterium]
MSTPFSERIPRYSARVEAACARWLPAEQRTPQRLHAAMRYAVLGGGKHLRPLLIYAAGETLGLNPSQLDGPAAAVEIIHAYSLIHDDLPAMDDDDLRRGRPTCHIAFDEATAILAGDALQPLAFEILANDHAMACSPAARVRMIGDLARACGSAGMAGGQAMDLAAVGRTLNLAEVESMHIHKTGALIRVCVQLACAVAETLPADTARALDHYGKCVGLAFQIHDDVLDEEGDTETLGKTGGADRARGKPTYPAVIGLADAKAHARALADEALSSLEPLGNAADPLRFLAEFVVSRGH